MKIFLTIFEDGKPTRKEKCPTLAEYIAMGRLKPGQRIVLADIGEIKGKECVKNAASLFVGDCTPYHEPSTSDAGIGWPDSTRMSKYVVKVYE